MNDRQGWPTHETLDFQLGVPPKFLHTYFEILPKCFERGNAELPAEEIRGNEKYVQTS